MITDLHDVVRFSDIVMLKFHKCSKILVLGFFYLGASNQCFYKPGAGANNPFSKIVGLLNTGAQIVTGATLGGRKGEHFKASMFVVHIV